MIVGRPFRRPIAVVPAPECISQQPVTLCKDSINGQIYLRGDKPPPLAPRRTASHEGSLLFLSVFFILPILQLVEMLTHR